MAAAPLPVLGGPESWRWSNRAGLAPILAERWHLAVLGYAEAVVMLTGFLLLAVLGLA